LAVEAGMALGPERLPNLEPGRVRDLRFLLQSP